MHAARQLPGVGDLHHVHKALVPLRVDASVERRHRARDLVVARRDAARAVLVLAVVDALVEVLPAQRLARGGIVEDELLEDVRRAVRPVEPRPLLELVDARAHGALRRHRALEDLSRLAEAVGRAVGAQQLDGLLGLGGLDVDLRRQRSRESSRGAGKDPQNQIARSRP
ncbi:MAG: hypothetical protein ACKVI4_17525 [Actinomycetales bacterium]